MQKQRNYIGPVRRRTITSKVTCRKCVTLRREPLPLPSLRVRSSCSTSRTVPVSSLANLCLKRSKNPHCFLSAICLLSVYVSRIFRFDVLSIAWCCLIAWRSGLCVSHFSLSFSLVSSFLLIWLLVFCQSLRHSHCALIGVTTRKRKRQWRDPLWFCKKLFISSSRDREIRIQEKRHAAARPNFALVKFHSVPFPWEN